MKENWRPVRIISGRVIYINVVRCISMIKIQNLSYKYPARDDFAVNNISLHIQKGEFVLLTGSTGCGKSTLLKCLNGIIPHESSGEFHGDVIVGGMNTKEHPIRILAQQVGLVFQNPDDQIFSTRVLDEVAFGPENLCFPKEEIRERVEWALEKVGMKEFIHESTSALSGGQKQRVAVASVLALKPGILVLDEPISQLDPKGAREVLGVVKRLSDEGMTIVLVEHRIHEVAHWADRIIVMDGGEIVLDEPAGKVFEHIDIFKKLGLRVPKPIEPYYKSNLPGKLPLKPEKTAVTKERPASGNGGSFPKGRKVIDVNDLWFSYESKKSFSKTKWILKDINLDICEGEIVALMGNNGSGKSTLLHHFAGIFRPQKGNLTVMGKNTNKYSAYKLAGTVGIMFQNPSLILTCDTVYDEISFGPKNLKIVKEEAGRRVSDCLTAMELENLKDYHPQTLSGGQRLRCAASSILSMTPGIILLDEPTSGQDIYHIRKLMDLCRQLAGDGRTVVFITHDFEIAMEYASRIIIMKDGKIFADCRPEEILLSEAVDELTSTETEREPKVV